MKIAVSVTENSPNAEVDPRFGRARGFLIYDTDTNTYQFIDNTESDQMSHGAGINAAQKVVDAGANVVLTGQVGPKAYEVLSSAGVEIITGVSGKAEEAIKSYLEGGMKGPGGPGSGFGPGRGFGFGRGMGMGRGFGRRMMGGPFGWFGFPPPYPPGWWSPWGFGYGPWGPEDELEFLKEWRDEVKGLLEEIEERIKELESM